MARKKPLEIMKKWPGGGIHDLAEVSATVLDQMDHDADTLASANALGKRVRVIRDYAQRGIVGPAERRGKELFYERHHLKQIVAARLLANDGVSLGAIASQFQKEPEVVDATLGVAQNPTLAQQTWEAMRDADERTQRSATHDTRTAFVRSASKTWGMRVKTRSLLDRLGVRDKYPAVTRRTRIDVAEWCSVSVDEDKLRELKRKDIEDLAGVILASLLQARSK